MPASRSASVDAASASGTTRETCLRSCASTQASSSKSCTSPAICTGRSLGSKLLTRFTPLVPARMARQKASLPMPLGLTTPIPVMTTRFFIATEQLAASCQLDNSFSDRRSDCSNRVSEMLTPNAGRLIASSAGCQLLL